jgi:hypothetical protein
VTQDDNLGYPAQLCPNPSRREGPS